MMGSKIGHTSQCPVKENSWWNHGKRGKNTRYQMPSLHRDHSGWVRQHTALLHRPNWSSWLTKCDDRWVFCGQSFTRIVRIHKWWFNYRSNILSVILLWTIFELLRFILAINSPLFCVMKMFNQYQKINIFYCAILPSPENLAVIIL